MMMATTTLQLFQPPLPSTSSSNTSLQTLSLHSYLQLQSPRKCSVRHYCQKMSSGRRRRSAGVVFVGKEETQLRVPSAEDDQVEEVAEEKDPSPEDLEYISQIKRVLELLKKNRDMIFSEVKLTVMIEDPREVERRRLIGIDDSETPTREDLADVLQEVNEGKIPKNRVALKMLADEMVQWPNLEVEVPKAKRRKSLYAKATDTGIDPEVAAKRLNIDWDSAADIEDSDDTDDSEVPAAVGYGALYLVTAFPVIIDMLPPSDALQSDHETDYEFPDSDFLSTNMLVKMGSLQQERQISVDPISLIESAYPRLELPPPPVITTPKVTRMLVPPPLLPAKAKFSVSLLGSTTSSPRLSLLKKKWKNPVQPSSPLAFDPLSRRHSVALTRLAHLQEKHLRKSKSCGEGRATAPSDDFDLWSSKVNGDEHEAKTDDEHKSGKTMAKPYDEEFKCGALCLFLPGFGRGKPGRPRKDVEKEITGIDSPSTGDSRHSVKKEMAQVISRTVSLEKFECGSWTSSAIVMDNEEEGDSLNHFFDLPLELIRTSANDADSPVAAAFVFDKDHRKGVLKTRGRKSHDSSRHVRFSTSSPGSHPTSPTSCITPRLRKARDDFNAFLAAQSP
ncbi:unnamed protein product [Camellia sinensis]